MKPPRPFRPTTAIFSSVGAALLAAACGPVLVITPSGDSGAPKQLEIDEAEARCGRSEPCACYALGKFHSQRGDKDEARGLYDRACTGGCAEGCTDLREAYFEGAAGVTRDPALGTRYAIRACRLQPAQCYAAGERFERGSGVAPDETRARTFFQEGCRHSDARSCAALKRLSPSAPAAAPSSG
jgi:TPR repeat protein